ncbi:Protein-export membrane protein SecD [uncultured archaeon]|nr:Protein-export membrane protein SecD [uncultured archaeon]
MKLTWRIWILVLALAFASISVLNLPVMYNTLVGLLIISILVTLSYSKSKKLTIILLVLTGLIILAILFFGFQKGVVITSVPGDSVSFTEGLRKGMIITSINGNSISNIEDYSKIISLVAFENKTKMEIQTTQTKLVFLTNESLRITVSNIPRTNLQTGLDLSGGARAIVKPANVTLSSSEMADLIAVMSNRLNTFGISDVNVRSVSDLSGNSYILVEVAGITTDDLKELVGQQGKFEAKIGNDTVFVGGERDITSVCRNDATCAGIDSCQPDSSGTGGYFCNFKFSIYLSDSAAKRQAEATKTLPLDPANPKYLSKKLDLVLDDKLVDSLYIGADLKGSITTQVQISGSGSGTTQEDAYNAAKDSMHKLQTILITGSLPYKLEIVKLDSASPVLGKEFTKNIIYLGLIVFLIVSIMIFLKYRRLKITLSVILTMFAEALITLGIAALIKWNLDAPSIAGLIAGIGTGVDDQIVIIDESVSEETSSLKDKIKRALFIIVGAFFVTIFAMLPLFWAGAGLLRGFALTTILGVSVGILITRPAFADILKKLQE